MLSKLFKDTISTPSTVYFSNPLNLYIANNANIHINIPTTISVFPNKGIIENNDPTSSRNYSFLDTTFRVLKALNDLKALNADKDREDIYAASIKEVTTTTKSSTFQGFFR